MAETTQAGGVDITVFAGPTNCGTTRIRIQLTKSNSYFDLSLLEAADLATKLGRIVRNAALVAPTAAL